MKDNLEYTLCLKRGQVSCRNFSMARKMFKKLTTAVAFMATDITSGEIMIYKTR